MNIKKHVTEINKNGFSIIKKIFTKNECEEYFLILILWKREGETKVRVIKEAIKVPYNEPRTPILYFETKIKFAQTPVLSFILINFNS